MAERSLFVGPDGGTNVRGPVGGRLLFKVRAEDTGGRLTAFDNVIPPGTGPPVHLHDQQDETWWVLEGQLRFRLADAEHLAPAGSFVWVPRGVAHAFRNDGDVDARLLVMFTPGGIEPFFDQLAAASQVRPEDFARAGALVGMRVTGPPLGAPA